MNSTDRMLLEDYKAGWLGDCSRCYYARGNLCTLSSANRTGAEPREHLCQNVNPTGKCDSLMSQADAATEDCMVYRRGVDAAKLESRKRAPLPARRPVPPELQPLGTGIQGSKAGLNGDCSGCYYAQGGLCTFQAKVRPMDRGAWGCSNANPTGTCRFLAAAMESMVSPQVRAIREEGIGIAARAEMEDHNRRTLDLAPDPLPRERAPLPARQVVSTPKPLTDAQLAQEETDAWLKEWNIGEHADIVLPKPVPLPGHFAVALANMRRNLTSMVRLHLRAPLMMVAAWTVLGVTTYGACWFLEHVLGVFL